MRSGQSWTLEIHATPGRGKLLSDPARIAFGYMHSETMGTAPAIFLRDVFARQARPPHRS